MTYDLHIHEFAFFLYLQLIILTLSSGCWIVRPENNCIQVFALQALSRMAEQNEEIPSIALEATKEECKVRQCELK